MSCQYRTLLIQRLFYEYVNMQLLQFRRLTAIINCSDVVKLLFITRRCTVCINNVCIQRRCTVTIISYGIALCLLLAHMYYFYYNQLSRQNTRCRTLIVQRLCCYFKQFRHCIVTINSSVFVYFRRCTVTIYIVNILH